jgi:hypothetical protein
MTEYPYENIAGSFAPTLTIEVRGQAVAPQVCKAMVDSGISLSGIPQRILEDVKALPVAGVSIVSVLGERKDMPLYTVDIAVGDIQRSLQVLPLDRNVALLGRDFLANCAVQLDGRGKAMGIAPLERVAAHLQQCNGEERIRELLAPLKKWNLGMGPDHYRMELFLDLSGFRRKVLRLKPEYQNPSPPEGGVSPFATYFNTVFIFGTTLDELIKNFDRFLRDCPVEVAPLEAT